MEYIKPKKSWCKVCKKDNLLKNCNDGLDNPLKCEDCYVYECGHPTTWHSEYGCHAMEDSCYCQEFKAKNRIILRK